MAVRRYVLAKVNLIKAGCPVELSAAASNLSASLPIVIERNRRKLGFVEATDYFPPAVVTAGAARRAYLLRQGVIRSWAMVESGSININADDKMGANELMQLLRQELDKKFKTAASNQPLNSSVSYPYIVEAYPFENYFIYSLREKLYKQGYSLDHAERKVHLIGSPSAVRQNYVEATADAPVLCGAKKKSAVTMPKDEFVREHRRLVDVLEKGSPNQRAREATEQREELSRA